MTPVRDCSQRGTAVRKYAYDMLCLAVLALAVGFYHRDGVLGRGVYFLGDFKAQDLPYRYYFSEALRNGRLPLWTPEMDCGWPLYAEGQSGVFYPLNWLLCLRPLYLFFNLSLVFHTFLSGAGAYFLARTLRIGRAGALVAGFALSFHTLFSVQQGCANFICSASWMCIVAGLFVLAMSSRRWSWLLLSAVAFALQFLAGHPYPCFWGLLLVLFLALGECWVSRSIWRRLGFVFGRLVVWGGVSLALASVQFLPEARLAAQTERAGGIAKQVIETGLKVTAFRTICSPRYLGSFHQCTKYVYDQQTDPVLFLGIPALCLIPFAVKSGRRKLLVLLLLIGLFGVLAALEGEATLLPHVLAAVKPFNMFRNRANYIMLTVVAVVLLSGLGVDGVLRCVGRRDAASQEKAEPDRRCSRGCWLLLGLVAAGALAAFAFQYAVRQQYVPGLPGMAPNPPDAAIAEQKMDLLLAGRHRDLICLPVFFGLSLLLIATILKGWVNRVVGGVALVALEAANVVFCGQPRPAVIDPQVLMHRPQALEVMPEERYLYRTYARWFPSPGDLSGKFASPDVHFESFHYNADLLAYDLGLFHGVQFINSWPGPLRLLRYAVLENGINLSGDPYLLGLLNVRYVLTMPDFPVNKRALELIYDRDVRVYENLGCLPRCFLVGEVARATEPWQALRFVARPGFLGYQTAVVEGASQELLPESERKRVIGQAHIVSYHNTRVEIDVETPQEAWLVLLDTYYPGWEATVDGKPATIYRTNYLFRGLRVPAGASRVVFRYVDWPFRIGAAITLSTLVGVILVLVTAARKKRGAAGPGETPPERGAEPDDGAAGMGMNGCQ